VLGPYRLTSRPSSKLGGVSDDAPRAHDSSPAGTQAADALARRPRPGETRERILEVALKLFNEQGYDKTSLREIAERLDVTKAALYYHFERKEDILVELHQRLQAVGGDLVGQLARLDDQEIVRAWPGLLDQFIEQVLANCELFLLRQRNHSAFEQLARSDHQPPEKDGIEQQVRRVLANPAIPLADRVRIASSIGGVVSALMGASGMFGEVPRAQLAELVRDTVQDLFPETSR
jgi:AcrR family transcriptional regulator